MSEEEKKWGEFDNQFGWLAKDSSFKSREAYKAALRREIEKIDTWGDEAYRTGCEQMQRAILQLLDTVEP